MTDSVLVIGGGIAGIQAALDLAEGGAQVVLVEREATIGGSMAVLDKNFPTLDCSICIEAPKMSEADQHPNIEILSLADVISVEGAPGQFTVQIRQRARYVTDACTRCGDCTEVCPELAPNEYDAGMAYRKAIHTPIPQSAPGSYVIDMDCCLNEPPNLFPCVRCRDICPPGAIDLMMINQRQFERQVGAIIVAVGYDMLDPGDLQEYSYGKHPDILTALEFERLLNSAGPTGGEIIRPSDGVHPDSILFVLCVGSRDQRHYRYCSRFCCMYSIKHAYQALDHGHDDVTVLFMDIRAFGKGFDGFYQRTRDMGAKFVRGRPACIEPGDRRIAVSFEDTDRNSVCTRNYELVVLANAVTPPDGLAGLAETLDIELDGDGFIKASETHGGLVITTRPGIYAAGCASGPKDIPDSVSEGSGAAALALGHLTRRTWPEKEIVSLDIDLGIPRIGVFICHCGSNIAGVIDVDEVVDKARSMPKVVFADTQMFSCDGSTQGEIEQVIRSEGINRVVIAACSPKTHQVIFRGMLVRAGLNPYLLEMTNIRNMNSWVHKFDKEAATAKATDMVAMAVQKALLLEPLQSSQLPLIQRVLVIGGGIAGMTAAAALGRQNFETHLIEKENYLGGMLERLDVIWPAGIMANELLIAKSMDLVKAGIHVHLGTEASSISGVVGNYQVQLTNGLTLEVGAIILATGASPFQPENFGVGVRGDVITNVMMESLIDEGVISANKITFLACLGSRQGSIGCSRYCCSNMIGQALQLRKMGKQVRVIGKDIRTYSRQAEELYEEAMGAGVQFFRYDPDLLPEEAVNYTDGYITVYDQLMGAKLKIPTELLVLVVGLRPQAAEVADQLKIARSEDGFLMELHPKLGPVETATQGIYLAGTVQGAKDVRESMAQALATAAKAGALLARGVIDQEPLTAQFDPERCIGCMRCIKVCPFGAIEQIGPVGKEGTIRILEAACRGCGTCAAECNFEAIEMPYFTKQQILAQIEATLAEHPEEKCVVFTCNWCSYAGADLAGIEKRQYPVSARIIRTMCSARIEEEFVTHAFDRGAGAVLITGCRLTDTGSDCHYNYANRLTEKRFNHWQRKLRRRDIEADRIQLRWISAAEGKEFAEKIHEMDDVLKRYQMAEQAL